MALVIGGLTLSGCAQGPDEKYSIGVDVCRKLPYSSLPTAYGTPGELPRGGEADLGDDGTTSCTRETSGGAIITTAFTVFPGAAEAFADYDTRIPSAQDPSPSSSASSAAASATASARPSPSSSVIGSATPTVSATGSPAASKTAGPTVTASLTAGANEVPTGLSGRVDAARWTVDEDQILIIVVDGNLVMTVTVNAAAAVDRVPGTPNDVADYTVAVLNAVAPAAA